MWALKRKQPSAKEDGCVEGLVIGTFTWETTAWMDCWAIAEEPLTFAKPFFTSGGAGWDGSESIGSSALAGGIADTGVIDTIWGGGAVDVAAGGWVCAGAKHVNICSMDCWRNACSPVCNWAERSLICCWVFCCREFIISKFCCSSWFLMSWVLGVCGISVVERVLCGCGNDKAAILSATNCLPGVVCGRWNVLWLSETEGAAPWKGLKNQS